MATMLLAAASVATAIADGVLVLPIRPANGGMRNGSFTTADTASPALTFRSGLAA